MGLMSNEITRNMLQPGDHIYTYRMLHTYSHHGIYVGDDRVIHYLGTKLREMGNSENRCSKCMVQPSKLQGVVKTCLDCFLKGHRLYGFEYNVSSSHFLIQRPGTCSTRSCDKPDVVVQRANDLLNKGFGDYDLFENNCECFAFYCKTGKAVSLQATFVQETGRGLDRNRELPVTSLGQAAKAFAKLWWTGKFEALRQDKYVNHK